MNEEQEKSGSGAPVYRYSEANTFKPAAGDGENIEAISDHIEKHIGKIEGVFHEIVSDQVHIDIHWVKPTQELPFHILVTSGMSDQAMNVPEHLEAPKYLELCMVLPPEWKVDMNDQEVMQKNFADENIYWPVRWLKIIARFPHSYNTWVGWGHTIPNGEHAAPFAPSTKLGCMMLLPSLTLSQDFLTLKTATKEINFLCLYPLYKEEMEFKLKNGADKLLDRFDEFNIMDVVSINRKNVCEAKKRFGFW